MGEYRYRYLGVLLAAVLVALGVLAYLYYNRPRPITMIDLQVSPARSPRKAWTSRSASKRTNRLASQLTALLVHQERPGAGIQFIVRKYNECHAKKISLLRHALSESWELASSYQRQAARG